MALVDKDSARGRVLPPVWRQRRWERVLVVRVGGAQVCVQGAMGSGIFTGMPLQLSGTRRLLEAMDWGQDEDQDSRAAGLAQRIAVGAIGQCPAAPLIDIATASPEPWGGPGNLACAMGSGGVLWVLAHRITVGAVGALCICRYRSWGYFLPVVVGVVGRKLASAMLKRTAPLLRVLWVLWWGLRRQRGLGRRRSVYPHGPSEHSRQLHPRGESRDPLARSEGGEACIKGESPSRMQSLALCQLLYLYGKVEQTVAQVLGHSAIGVHLTTVSCGLTRARLLVLYLLDPKRRARSAPGVACGRIWKP